MTEVKAGLEVIHLRLVEMAEHESKAARYSMANSIDEMIIKLLVEHRKELT